MKRRSRAENRKRRHFRIRKKIRGTGVRPRMCVHVSNKHLYVQVIDDQTAHTLACTSTLSKDFFGEKNNRITARKLGERIAGLVKEKGVESVVFDRGGFHYGTRIRELADGAREAGPEVLIETARSVLLSAAAPAKRKEEKSDFEERVVHVNRCSKVVKGGRRFSFSALVIVGDRHGRVGYAMGKASEVADAIRKASEQAKRNLTFVPMRDHTLSHEVLGKFSGARVLLRPASEGTGVIAGGSCRTLLELAGVRDVLAKSLGSNNHFNVVKATENALHQLRTKEQIDALRRG